MTKSKGIKYDNCKDCDSKCNHAGKDRVFVCPKGVSCKVEKETPMTNADRIRAMSDEELATDLLDVFQEICEDGMPCKEWMLHWLRQPAEVDCV